MRKTREGFGLVELMIAIACFLMALVPLLSLYSVSIDSANVIQLRAQACSFAQEVLSQAVLSPPQDLKPGSYKLEHFSACQALFPGDDHFDPSRRQTLCQAYSGSD